MRLAFEHGWVLLLLPLAVLPLLPRGARALDCSSAALLPRDRLSRAVGWAVRFAAVCAVTAAVGAAAGPYLAEQSIERLGQGAEMVIVFDRSASMDQPFFVAGTYHPLEAAQNEPKAAVARRLLQSFVAERREDRFALILFSAFPIQVLDFTQRYEVIEAAIAASGLGRGLGETDIGRALLAGAALFAERPYSASRVVLLVSDGGAHLDPQTRARIRELFRRERIALYWIYLRSHGSPGLLADRELPEDLVASVPEHFLHAFFRDLPTPYRAYEAENPQAVRRAIADIARIERFPIRYREVLPRRDLTPPLYAAALGATLLLVLAAGVEVRAWT
ncbi:MAG TPA: vWA domain-containing protein [Burkholderiales bacterium]